MRSFVVALAAVGLLFLAGCAEHLPPLSVVRSSAPPTVTDVTDHVACELRQIVDPGIVVDKNADAEQKNGDPAPDWEFTDNAPAVLKTDANALVPAPNHPDMAGLVQYLTKYHFVATVNLTLEVTDTEGVAPSLSFITPFNRMKLAGSSYATALGGQLNGTQDRKMTLSYPIDLANLPQNVPADCADTQGAVLDEAGRVIGVKDGLAGHLGLADIIADGLVTLDKTSPYSGYGSSGPNDPTVSQTMDASSKNITLDLQNGDKPLNITGFDGTASFAPPSITGIDGKSVSLAGIVTFQGGEQCYAALTGYALPGTIPAAKNPASSAAPAIAFFATGPLTWIPTNIATDGTVSIGVCDGTSNAIVRGFVDTNYMTKRQAPGGYFLRLEFYSDGSGKFPNLAASPPKIILSDVLSDPVQPPSDATVQSVTAGVEHVESLEAPLSPKLIAAATAQDFTATLQYNALAAAHMGGGNTGGAQAQSSGGSAGAVLSSGGGGSTTTSSNGTSFGSTVTFTVVYGLNGGPSWTLTHFKGPGNSGSLFSLGRTVVDTLNINFVPACQDPATVPAAVSSYWDTIGPCNASSFANAAAAGQAQIFFSHNNGP